MNHIRGIVVSVDYADLLAKSIERWHTGLDRLLVVTTPRDRDTIELCRHHNVEAFQTEIFYANGASFNKGAALSEAILKTGYRHRADWILSFDADTVPPDDWRFQILQAGPQCGSIYGVKRSYCTEGDRNPVPTKKTMPQGWVLGFFMLFHADDPHLPGVNEPLFDLCWPHAGNYDTMFCRRWPKQHQVVMGDIVTAHLGEERVNWTGRNNKGELKTILAKRCGWEDWQHERMPNPPTIS